MQYGGDLAMKILIVKPSSLGDIIHVFPAVELLRRRYPDAEYDWLVHPAFADMLEYSPVPVRRKILFDRKKLGALRTFPGAFSRLLKELRRESYDLVFDFQGLLRSGFLAFASKRRGPVVGFANPRERICRIFYGKRFPVPYSMHAVERNVALVNAFLGTADAVPQYVLPPCGAQDTLGEAATGKTVIGIIPGARWVSKQFPAELFADVIRELRRRVPENPVFWIIGSPGEKEQEKLILELAGNEKNDILPLAGKTSLPGMTEALRHCSAVLCNDSGPMHAAASLQIPVAAFFGPTRPDLTGPYGEKCRVIRRDGLACLGCMDRTCCKADGLVPCQKIDAGEVAGVILELLSGK